MDKNKIIALTLISALFFAFSYFNTKEQEKYSAEKAAYEAQVAEQQAAIEEATASKPAEIPVTDDQKRLSQALIGESLTTAKIAQSEIVKMSNDVMNVEFSTRGGIVKMVELVEYTKYSDDDRTELVKMFDPESAQMDLSFYIRNGLNNLKVNTMDYTFEAEPIVKVEGGEQLVMSLAFDSGARLEYVYTLY